MTSPSPLDRLRRFDPAVLPILVAGLVLVLAVAWLISRPLPATAPVPAAGPDPRLAEEVAALRAELARQAGRVAGLEGRAGPDLGPVREQLAAATARATALEERVTALTRDLAARPAVDPATLAPRAALDQLSLRVDRAADRIETATREQMARDAQEAARIEQIGRDTAARQAAMEQAQLALVQRITAAEGALASRAQTVEAQAARIAALEQLLAARTAAIEAQAGRLAALEGTAQRLAALEGRSARMALVDGLRMALDAGRPLGPQLGTLSNPPAPLARFATAAPPTEAALRLSFEEAARAGRQASEPAREGGVVDSAMARLSGLVTVRRGEEVVWGDAAAAEIERARRALEAGDLEASLRHLTRLPPQAREAMRGWTGQAEALIAARAALRQLAAG